MTPETLRTALDLITKRDETTSSEDLRQVRDDLDIAGARQAYDDLEARRAQMLLLSSDEKISKIESEMSVAMRDVDRRRAASQAIDHLITAALDREAEEAIQELGEAARAAQGRAAEAYVKLDAAALQFVEAYGTIGREEATLTEANSRLRSAGRRDLVVEMPMDSLPRLTGVEPEFWVPISHWTFDAPGYTHEPPGREGTSAARVIGKRRFGALAALLPGAPPVKLPAIPPSGPPYTPQVRDGSFLFPT